MRCPLADIMKTEILESYQSQENEFIKKVIFIDSNQLILYSYLYPEKINRIVYLGAINREFTFPRDRYQDLVMISKYNIGILNNQRLIIFDEKGERRNIIPIKNPMTSIGERNFSHYVHYSWINENEILLTIQHWGAGDSYYARYFSLIEIRKKFSILPKINKKYEAIWRSEIIQPNKEKFSPLYFDYGDYKSNGDWLSIKSICALDKEFYFYTDGGAMTRGKTRTRFEMSEIGILNRELEVGKVEKIKNGFGNFSSDKKYFLQQEYKNERNLNVYNLVDFSVQTIRLTPKKNLGLIKKYAIIDMWNEEYYLLYNSKHLNICRFER